MQKCGENMREENGGNIDRSCFVGRELLWKKRGKGKRKFVVIIWGRWKNRGKRREIRAVFAPRQAVYNSKLYLVFSMPTTLACLLLALCACVWQILPAPQQTNQSYFTVWQSFILQFGNQSYFYLGCWETNQPIKSPSIAVTVQICTYFARLWCGQKVRILTFTYGSFGNLIIKNHPVSLAMTGLEVNLIINKLSHSEIILLLPRILRKVNLVQNVA